MPKPSPTKTTDLRLSVAEAASLFGMTPRWLQALVKAGHIEKPARGEYRLGAVCSGVLAHMEARIAAGSKAAAGNRASEARAREIELRIAERQRDLIPVEDAKAVVAQIAGLAKAELVGLPARFTRDPEMKRRLEVEVDGMLRRMAEAAERAAADAAGAE